MSRIAEYDLGLSGPSKRLTLESMTGISDNYELPLMIRLLAEIGVRLIEVRDELRAKKGTP